jgi:outer membrane protein TolC
VRAKSLMLAVGLLAAGCTRSWYRVDADRETYPTIDERIVDPAYDIGRTRLDPAPTSRLFDPYDPDHPPKPPDDPAAAAYMARPGGLKGARGWEKDGDIDQIEPPNWQQYLGLDEKGVLHLNTDRAVDIALNNSREYQTALEQVYLTALGLTLNRYEFDLHWFARNATAFTHSGSGGAPTESNQLTINSDAGFTRNLAAGGQLLVDFANSIVLEFTGKGKATVGSNIVVTLAQPLLRNAGRAVRLESLTQAERNVLYAVRDFAQFRKQFWANVAIQNGGYLDLLLAEQTLRNSQANLKQQNDTYKLYNELFRGGRASVVEFDQVFQQLLAGRQQVIDSEASFESALDRFKLRLGVPPRIPVELDAALLSQFIVVDPSLEKLREEAEAFQRARLKELNQPPTAKELIKHFETLRGLANRIPAKLELAAADLAKWGKQLAGPAQPGDDTEQRERAKTTYDGLTKMIPEIVAEVKKVTAAIDKHRAGVAEATRKESWEAITDDAKIVLTQVDSVIGIQTPARTYLIRLPTVDYKEDEALTLAKDNRLDLQNRLAAVTDAWRQVRITANALRSDLNVIMSSNIGTDPDHNRPFNFSAEASKYTVGFQFDGPLNRQAERNAYRASLIVYQQAKRAYVALADQVEAQVRQDLRQLNRLRTGFEIARQKLLSAARQVENSRLLLLGPREKRTANDTTTLNLLQALSTLLDARNQLSANYINFEQQRIQLLLDLEMLQLDSQGYPVHVHAPVRSATAADLSPVGAGNFADDRTGVQPGTPGGS